MDVYSIKFDGKEVALVTGEGITCGRKEVQVPGRWGETQTVDDPKMLRIAKDGIPVLVFYVTNSTRATVEKVDG